MQSATVETIRLGADTKIHLSTLKRRTGIQNWNTICRWAFCLSLSDPAPVRSLEERGVGAVEMTWKTFAGAYDDVYLCLLVDRCQRDHGAVDRDLLATTLRQHIARGAARLASNRELQSTGDLLRLAVTALT